MRTLVIAFVITMGLLGTAGVAHAYPQFQLVRDQTCTGCHISPSGGGMLNENGLNAAEAMSQLDHSAKFLYKVNTPKWLQLSGDLRAVTGFIQTPEQAFVAFPMQIETNVRFVFGAFSLYATPGLRPTTEGNAAATFAWAREHYVMWQQKPEESQGLYVRLGRFMPTFGLRFAEHPMYTRRFGGTQLFSETYGLGVAYVKPRYEVHATGFIADPIIDPVENANGAALYAETRIDPRTALGVEGMVKVTPDLDKQYRVGVTAKKLLGKDLLLQGELQFVNTLVENKRNGAGTGAPTQLVGSLVLSKPFGKNDQFLVDLGIGHFDSNLRIRDLDRDCVDLNVHWFVDSHVELILNSRVEMLAFGNGGPNAGYALLQVHFRL
ncbi:MAG: hypothetical protein KIT31_14185 [Deltaproteobacteria bacterium]|nr:hypothetical protein [Deltaproteobacteria bacterium]